MTATEPTCALCGADLTPRERTACDTCLDKLYHVSKAEGHTPATARVSVRRHLMRLRVTRELRELEELAA